MRKRQNSSFKLALEFDNMREQYEELLVKRDQLQKEANSIRISYNKGLLEPTIEEQFGAKVPDRTTLTLPLVVKDQAPF